MYQVHVERMLNAENIRIVLFVVVSRECWVRHQVADQNVLSIRIVLQIGPVLTSDAVILVSVFVDSMHCVLLRIINPSVRASKATKVIRMQDAVNDQVSATFSWPKFVFSYSYYVVCHRPRFSCYL